jgi:hypothetical protein
MRCFTTIPDLGDAIELTVSSVKRAIMICAADIKKHCGNVEAGASMIAQCLVDNMVKLSPACRGEVTGVEARIKN